MSKQQTKSTAPDASAFRQQVANLCLWDWDANDGTLHHECEQPSDGHFDSHACLMSLIEQARAEIARTASTCTEAFTGYLAHEGVRVDVEFAAPQGAGQTELDAAFLAALAQKANLNYLSVGTMSDAHFFSKEGSICPVCGSTAIEGGPVDIDEATATQEVGCNDCNASWKSVFTRNGYTELVKA